MKKIVVKHSDGQVSFIMFDNKKFGDGLRPLTDLDALKIFTDETHSKFCGEICGWYVTDDNIDKSDIESREQLYWDDSLGATEIKKDMSWENCLMSDQTIKKKYLEDLKKEIDEELFLETTDVLKVLKLKHEYDSLKERKTSPNSSDRDLFWLEISKSGLDKRLEKGKADKPIIREKLEAKISELKGK